MSDGDNNISGLGRSLGGGPAEPLPSSWPQRLRSGPGRIATLGSMGQSSGGRRAQSHGDDSDSDDDREKAESWFAGGERRHDFLFIWFTVTNADDRFSGISIENPDSQRSVPGGNLVRDLLQRAAQ